MSLAASVILSVCLSVCLHDKTKTAETKTTKLTCTGIVHHDTVPHLLMNIRSKGQRSRSQSHSACSLVFLKSIVNKTIELFTQMTLVLHDSIRQITKNVHLLAIFYINLSTLLSSKLVRDTGLRLQVSGKRTKIHSKIKNTTSVDHSHLLVRTVCDRMNDVFINV